MWEKNILLGQWLFVACCIAYLIWWCFAFRPGYTAPGIAKILPFVLTAIFGIAGLSFVIMGCQGAKDFAAAATGAGSHSGVGNIYIIGACAAAYMILLVVTNVVMHRQVTTELMLIVFWICMQLCIINTMYGNTTQGSGWSLTAAIILAVLAIIAAAAGMICYLMYYNLEPMKGFYMGMVPLILFAAYGAGIAIYQMAT